MEKKTFTKRLGAFASATLISRILGFGRDAAVAYFFGGGVQTDAFYAAFKVPSLLRRFLGEGSLTAAFVPVFTETLAKNGSEEANRLFNAVFSGLAVILGALVALGIGFAPLVARLVAFGFVNDPAKFQLTVELIRLTVPFLLVVALAALLSAVLNANGSFFTPAIAPCGLSIAEIAFIALLAARMHSPIHGLAVAAVVGGLIHFLWQVPALYRLGYPLKLVRPFAHPQVRTVFLLMIPTIIGLCSDQINSFVDQFCASFLPTGSVTALYNSNRVMQLPLALFGVAVASVSLPVLSKSAATEDLKGFKDLLSFSLRIVNFVLVPSFVGLAVLAGPIVGLLFHHGRFTEQAASLTVQALVPYALGLPAYSATKILASGFYARKDTKTPVRVSVVTMLLNVVLNFSLMWRFKVAGLAFATAASSWIHAAMLWWLLRRRLGLLGGREIAKSFLHASAAGVFMGVVAGTVALFLMRGAPQSARVAAGITSGIAVYFSVARLFKIEEYRFFLDLVFRRQIDV